MRGIILLLSLTIFIFLESCTQKITNIVKGPWSIDTVLYLNTEIRHCFLSNLIDFDIKNCDLPITEQFCDLEVYGRNSIWEIKKDQNKIYFICFDTNNKIFNGCHRILFNKDEKNKLLKMEIISDDLRIISSKGLFNYDQNMEEIDKVIYLTSSK